MAGSWVSTQKNICFVGAPDKAGEATLTDCAPARDKLKIRKIGKQYTVNLSMVFANGHACEFDGTGEREGPRLIAIDPEFPSCPMTLRNRGNQIQLSQASECRFNFCGARGSIDGAVFFRRRVR